MDRRKSAGVKNPGGAVRHEDCIQAGSLVWSKQNLLRALKFPRLVLPDAPVLFLGQKGLGVSKLRPIPIGVVADGN